MKRAIAVIVWTVASCAPSANQVRASRIDAAKQNAESRIGAKQAADFAAEVHAAQREGLYKAAAYQARLQSDTQSAIAALDRAMPGAGHEAATLVAWRGLMLLDAGNHDAGWQTLLRSQDMRPNELAARNLVLVYGLANKTREIGEVCRATTMALTTVDDQYDFIGYCNQHMNAIDDAAALAWATPEIREWYEAQRAKRAARQQQAQAAADAQAAQEKRIVRQTESCTSRCKEVGHYCLNRCDGDADCQQNCVAANHACVDRCVARAQEKLGQ